MKRVFLLGMMSIVLVARLSTLNCSIFAGESPPKSGQSHAASAAPRPPIPAEDIGRPILEKEIAHLREDVRVLREDVKHLVELLEKKQPDLPTQTVEPAKPDPEMRTTWDLTLDQVINLALQNAAPLRRLGLSTMSLFSNDRTVIAARASERNPTEILTTVQAVVSDVEDTYWGLWLAREKLETAKELRTAAQAIWQNETKKAPEHLKNNTVGSVQARSQYFLFRSLVEQALKEFNREEERLRGILGLATSDGRMIIPSDKPWDSKVKVEWDADSWNEAREQVNTADTLARFSLDRSMAAAADVETVTELYRNGKVTLDLVLDSQRRLFDCRNGYHEAIVAQAVTVKDVLVRSGTFLEQRHVKVRDGSSKVLDDASPN